MVSRARTRQAALRRLTRHHGPARPVPGWVGDALTRADIAGDHRRLLDGWLLLAALCVATVPLAPQMALVTGLAAVAPPVWVWTRQRRADHARVAALPLALDAMASALRGGHSLTGAVRAAATSAGPLEAELAALADHATAGRELGAVVADWSEGPTADPGRRLAAAALALTAEVGGAGALAIDAASSSLRERAEADAEINALSVQARLSAWLLTLTPIGFAALLSTLDPASARFLFTTPAGLGCIAVGATLDALGARWMQRIVANAQ